MRDPKKKFPIMDAHFREKYGEIMLSLGAIMTQVCQRNDPKVTDNMINQAGFVGKSIPDMPLQAYLDRCKKYFRCTPAAMVLSVVYIDRITSRDTQLLLHSLNVHRLFATALVLACKYLEDQVFSNKFYAQVAGVSVGELNQFELQFVSQLEFELNVSPEKFEEYLEQLAPSLFETNSIESMDDLDLNATADSFLDPNVLMLEAQLDTHISKDSAGSTCSPNSDNRSTRCMSVASAMDSEVVSEAGSGSGIEAHKDIVSLEPSMSEGSEPSHYLGDVALGKDSLLPECSAPMNKGCAFEGMQNLWAHHDLHGLENLHLFAARSA